MQPPDERRRTFEQVYAACHDPVVAYVLRRADSAHDAADVVAETFLTAWRRLEDMPRGDAARPWLYGIARRVLANHYRGVRRRSALSERLGAELAASYRPAEYDEDLTEVAAAFRALSDDDRELLSLVGWENLDPGQIATALGCSRNAARIRLHRARKRFARELQSRAAAEHTPRARVAKGEHA
ncbi:RNA polymerase sigma factor [Actinoallomurus acaciae]|uniref:RNA polymerase sigma factor n=1 Tax=Actinoallomurus acaciae TaxID=502577 RepID=A0ABV5YC77_9ACTN